MLLELQNAALVINNTLQEECASHLPKGIKPGSSSTPNRGTSTGQPAMTLKKLSNNPNFVLEEEHNRCCAKGTCIKCRKMGHKFAECHTGWKATPKEDKGKPKETAKIGKEFRPNLGKD
ncbi:Retrotransposon-derived protein PEG10 [Rhizoctonia solani]|uniref:Retrotransposon-derived protein PEG10 n=1 Tax=Rhizoctonia solani TaxID=456999 RepID=A0A8H8P3J8_9AGAM|nr:Retrotransposon-derived protein PEG10 [Rhizoctonia solani]QRW23692.1 Retrotransposon-derived protein PEG10 [Rhizoctonia solani]